MQDQSQESKSFANGRKLSMTDFSTGNSGNTLFDAVVKIGPECQQEGAYCQLLGSDVAPRILSIIPGGYIMEKLRPVVRYRHLLVDIERLLQDKVWSRPALQSSDEDFRDHLKKYGIEVPDWAMPKEFCMVHGDPTVSNCLVRSGQLILCDPRPPRNYIPQCKETDMGRILQSYMGWECVAYGVPRIRYTAPDFMHSKEWSPKAKFWCGAAATRIKYLENSRGRVRPRIIAWCERVEEICAEE